MNKKQKKNKPVPINERTVTGTFTTVTETNRATDPTVAMLREDFIAPDLHEIASQLDVVLSHVALNEWGDAALALLDIVAHINAVTGPHLTHVALELRQMDRSGNRITT